MVGNRGCMDSGVLNFSTFTKVFSLLRSGLHFCRGFGPRKPYFLYLSTVFLVRTYWIQEARARSFWWSLYPEMIRRLSG